MTFSSALVISTAQGLLTLFFTGELFLADIFDRTRKLFNFTSAEARALDFLIAIFTLTLMTVLCAFVNRTVEYFITNRIAFKSRLH